MNDINPPIRVQILEKGIQATASGRNYSYGDPLVNLGLAGTLKAVVRDWQQRALGPAEMEAMDMVLTKVARVFTGSILTEDTYVDGATYFAIAGEVAKRQEASEKGEVEEPFAAQPEEPETPIPSFLSKKKQKEVDAIGRGAVAEALEDEAYIHRVGPSNPDDK